MGAATESNQTGESDSQDAFFFLQSLCDLEKALFGSFLAPDSIQGNETSHSFEWSQSIIAAAAIAEGSAQGRSTFAAAQCHLELC